LASSPCGAGEGRALRRTLILAALVVAAAVLVWLVPAPKPTSGVDALRGVRLFEVEPAAVTQVDFRLRDEPPASLVRADGAWSVDGHVANAGESAAIDDLVTLLARLRAADAFESDDPSQFVLDPPQATITVVAGGRRVRLDLGGFNSTGTTVYARRSEDARVFQLGTQMLSSLQAVLFQRKLAGEAEKPAA